MASVKELKETIEKAIIEFSKENEVDSMNVHVTIQKKPRKEGEMKNPLKNRAIAMLDKLKEPTAV